MGKTRYSGFVGVYVFTHIATGSMYVGSSNFIRRRMEYYFNKYTTNVGGKFLPLLNKDGISAFKVKIFKLDMDKFKVSDCLILEQYFLLDKKYDLNTLKVVNFGPQCGNSVYVYDLFGAIIYYHASSIINLKRVLGVHPEFCAKYINSGIAYLGSFILLGFLLDTAVPSELTVSQLLKIMNNERKALYDSATRGRNGVYLEVLEGNKFVEFIPGKKTHLEFDYRKECVIYLKSLGLRIKNDTLSKRIKAGKEFYNFFCKYR